MTMPDDDFTVMLDKLPSISGSGTKIGGAELRGKPIYREGPTGLADSIEDIITSGLIHVPTFRLIGGRARVGKDEEVWSKSHYSNAERITAYDEKGIMGAKGTVYALDIQNGGLFVWNPERIRKAVKGGKLVDGALQLSQEEVNTVLDAIKRKDYAGLKQIVHGRGVVFAGDYDGFLEVSAPPILYRGIDNTYVVVRRAEGARLGCSGMDSIDDQRSNPDLIIASGGTRYLNDMLCQASSFGWILFGSWHDGYKNNNTGRVVFLGSGDGGVGGDFDLDSYDGRSVGVAPEALNAFYRLGDVNSLFFVVNEAMKKGELLKRDVVEFYMHRLLKEER